MPRDQITWPSPQIDHAARSINIGSNPIAISSETYRRRATLDHWRIRVRKCRGFVPYPTFLFLSTLVTSRWTNHIPACGTYVPVPPSFSARVPDIFVAVRFRYTYSPTTSICFVFWLDGATDNSLHHRWTAFPISSSIQVECCVSFCPFFHISVTVQKSTQDRTICAFIPAILLNLSLRLWLNIFIPWSWSLWIYVTLKTILILTN